MFTFIHPLSFVIRFVTRVFPQVSRELDHWRTLAAQIPDRELAAQALASIRDKKFHCQGGCIYSLYPGTDRAAMIRFIVALQTISDYLDNLCDRLTVYNEAAFRQLHLAMTDALTPHGPLHNYYQFYPLHNDGAYLKTLVLACRREVSCLPGYAAVQVKAFVLARLYGELQTYKHLAPDIREETMLRWTSDHLPDYPGLSPWEFAAATGSTLGLFMLCAAAACPHPKEETARTIATAYFPYITGLHILLDYFIDAKEDGEHGDLNFTAYYADDRVMADRLAYFINQASVRTQMLPNSKFHQTVICGLLAMYLSDPKTDHPPEQTIKTTLLSRAGWFTRLCYAVCRLLRRKKLL